jgi:hypothetical protein
MEIAKENFILMYSMIQNNGNGEMSLMSKEEGFELMKTQTGEELRKLMN